MKRKYQETGGTQQGSNGISLTTSTSNTTQPPRSELRDLTDEEIRGAGSGTDTDIGASSVETDWVIPDLRNTRLSDANPIPLDHEVTANQQNGDKIVLVRCLSLKPYFKVACFQINVQTGQMYMHTQPAMDVGINCQMEEFDLDILRARLDTISPPLESQRDEGTLPRILLVQRTGPINEIMTEQEAWDILNRYRELCKLYATAYHELSVHAKHAPVEQIKACNLIEPYISDVLEQVDATLDIFCMENELRRQKGLEHFKIPELTPNGCTIESVTQLDAYCKAVDNEVKTIFEETFKPERTRMLEEQRRARQPLHLTTAIHHTTQSHQPTFVQAEIKPRATSTISSLQPNQHQAMTPPRVSNTHMPTHTLQQQNTPTRGHPTSHLSRHSTPPFSREVQSPQHPSSAPSSKQHNPAALIHRQIDIIFSGEAK